MPNAVVRRVWNETPRCQGVVLEVEADVAKAYHTPGQIVVLKPNAADKVYLAIASFPGEARGIELLLGPAAQEKLGLKEGATVSFDAPSGRGFQLAHAAGKDVFLFAVGSGLAPIRPLVEHIRRNRSDYGRVLFYAGAHSEEDFPYRREFDGWKRDRIDLVRSISKPWVQDRFKADRPTVTDAVAYVVGMKPMVEGVTEALVRAGLPKDRIGSNW